MEQCLGRFQNFDERSLSLPNCSVVVVSDLIFLAEALVELLQFFVQCFNLELELALLFFVNKYLLLDLLSTLFDCLDDFNEFRVGVS